MIGNSGTDNNDSGDSVGIDIANCPKIDKPVARKVLTLQDVLKSLETPTIPSGGGTPAYDYLIKMMRKISFDEDPIQQTNKFKCIAKDFCSVIKDGNTLRESITYFNNKALDDADIARKFALTFASRQFDVLSIGMKTIRSEMIIVLNNNYRNANTMRQQNRIRLYNSITLLGKYYQQIRSPNNKPIDELGVKLLESLINEITDVKNINDVKLAELVFIQIAENGDLLRTHHRQEVSELLFIIKKNLIEQDNLKQVVKACMLMTLDNYFTNFCNLGKKLENLYMKYCIMAQEDESEKEVKKDNESKNITVEKYYDNDFNVENKQKCEYKSQKLQQQQLQEQEVQVEKITTTNPPNSNVKSPNTNDNMPKINSASDGIFVDVSTDNKADKGKAALFKYHANKTTWSDEICEDDTVIDNDFYENSKNLGRATLHYRKKNISQKNETCHVDDLRLGDHREVYISGKLPRPLRHHSNNGNAVNHASEVDELYNDNNLLPRWRATRFYRNDNENNPVIKAASKYNKKYYHQNPDMVESLQNDNDKLSYYDFGVNVTARVSGDMPLHSVNDRLKYIQGKIERNRYEKPPRFQEKLRSPLKNKNDNFNNIEYCKVNKPYNSCDDGTRNRIHSTSGKNANHPQPSWQRFY